MPIMTFLSTRPVTATSTTSIALTSSLSPPTCNTSLISREPTTHAASRAPTRRRRCTSAIKYGQMQVGADAHGGLYKRYTLFDYLPNSTGKMHGYPDPVLLRSRSRGTVLPWPHCGAFNILGNPLVMLPNQLKKDLRELQGLY
ncbi:uncharacterized protein K441DRAFT_110680 [Cenococcum geophilum 1.58]|uniref:uncharacterized protein n=1 Tax=Cenococcum geophilum 1.58 TaxID=794803 RepID=UPI00358DE60C|nr:hypothetical protein K441DRAFT_110680 [Cenococcum geophilum 1.58]